MYFPAVGIGLVLGTVNLIPHCHIACVNGDLNFEATSFNGSVMGVNCGFVRSLQH